jgi:hypothetical protein
MNQKKAVIIGDQNSNTEDPFSAEYYPSFCAPTSLSHPYEFFEDLNCG